MLVDEFKAAEAQDLLDLDKPSLRALSHILRHREFWPKKFLWNFGQCEQCALGLAHKLWWWWAKKGHDYFCLAEWAFGLDVETSTGLFGGRLCDRLNRPHSAITPEIVADAIDAYLARRS